MIANLPRQHSYREEVAPVILIGILLNLLGHFGRTKAVSAACAPAAVCTDATLFAPSILFLDSVGTAYVAYLLGPWWAAGTGVLSFVFNSYRINDYSIYVVVSALLGLVWGYGLQFVRRGLRGPSGDQVVPKRRYPELFVLCVVAALIATFSADAMKLLLFPLAGADIFGGHHQHHYAQLSHWIVKQTGVPWHDSAALVVFNSYRNVLDKTIALLLGVLCAYLSGYRFTRPHGTSTSDNPGWRDALRVSADSIVFFVLVYATYLFAARIVLHTVSFSGTPGSEIENWMGIVGPILFSPFPIGVVAFVFLTLNRSDPRARRIEEERELRVEFYESIRSPLVSTSTALEKLEVFKAVRSKSVYGVIVSVVAWPTKVAIAGHIGLVIYITATLFFALVFFASTRERQERIRKSLEIIRGIRRVDGHLKQGSELLSETVGLLKGFFAAKQETAIHGDSVAYYFGTNVQTSGWLDAIRSQRNFDQLVVVAPVSWTSFSSCHFAELQSTLSRSQDGTALVVCDSVEPATLRLMKDYVNRTRQEIVIFDSAGLYELAAQWTRGDDISTVVAKGRLLSMELELTR